MLVGVFLGWVLAVMAVRYRVDQIIVGVVINLFVLGLTGLMAPFAAKVKPDYAVEHFFPNGPFAVLPMTGNRCAWRPMT